MKTNIFFNSSLGFLSLSAVLFLGSCANQKEKEIVQPESNYEVPVERSSESTEMADIMHSKGMVIYKGESRLDLASEHDVTDLRLVASSKENIVADGLPYKNYKFKFSRNDRMDLVVIMEAIDGSEIFFSTDAKLSGQGNDYSIEAAMVSKDGRIRFHLIITSKKGSESKGMEFAVIRKADQSRNLKGQLVRKFEYCIFRGNEVEKEVAPSIERRAAGHQISVRSVLSIL